MRGYLLAIALSFVAGLLWAQTARLGNAPYTPTKLEWAALELQVKYGEDFSPHTHVSMSFRPEDDGRTVRCLFIYDHIASAGQSKAARELMQMRVNEYAKHKGWDWLRLNFKEETMPE